MKKVLGSVLLSTLVGGFAFAEGEDHAYPSHPGEFDEIGGGLIAYPDMHSHNRAIAFGSVQLVQAGFDMAEWKALFAFEYGCLEPIDPMPIPPGGDWSGSHDEDDSNPGFPLPPSEPIDCPQWEVNVTTSYQMKECEDGRAFIERSGVGVLLYSRFEGDTYNWTEVAPCWSGINSKETSLMDKDRPLNPKQLKRTR